MVESLAVNSMLKKQARHVGVYTGDLNTSYSFLSVNKNLFMTSQGRGDVKVVAMVEWIKSKLSDNAKEVRASLATNRFSESMPTGSQASLYCRGALLLHTHQTLLNASPAGMVPSKAEAGLCCR